MISVITWDAGFRESFHTIECFLEQSHSDFEFIWVDYYQVNPGVRELCARQSGFHAISLDSPSSSNWHLGRCINAGVDQARGDLLVIPDGDIVVGPDFLVRCAMEHREEKDSAIYYRRFDEPEPSELDSPRTIEYLERHTILKNPTNYAGCVSLSKSLFDQLKGYEEHEAFAGPGINGMELYTRIRNSGAFVRWSDQKIYHPWHRGSGGSGKSPRLEAKLRKLAGEYTWIHPYAGLAQSWIVRQRELDLATEASTLRCEQLLARRPRKFRIDD